MQRSLRSMLKAVGLSFVLVAGMGFAVPPAALASCSCSGFAQTTPPYQAIEPTCEKALRELNEFFADSEGQSCGTAGACGEGILITQACFQRPDGQYEIDGYERFLCWSGTTCL